MSPQLRRLLLAIVAWPAGIIAALAVLIIPAFLRMPTCPDGETCSLSVGLSDGSLVKVVLWLGLALGPGFLATRSWWRHRRGGGDDMDEST